MGNVTTTLDFRGMSGNQFVGEGILTMSTSYAAGGDTLTARQCGLGFVNTIQLFQTSSQWNLTAGSSTSATSGIPGASLRVMAFGVATSTLVATTSTGLGQVFVNLTNNTWGTTNATAVTTPVSGNQEATAATDLSAIKCRFRAEGF